MGSVEKRNKEGYRNDEKPIPQISFFLATELGNDKFSLNVLLILFSSLLLSVTKEVQFLYSFSWNDG